jgi:hypothetical protein
MDLSSAFLQINWLSVVVSALAAFAVGGLWYSPVLFSKSWKALNNFTDEHSNGANMLLIFGSTFILNVIGAFVLDMFIGKEATLFTGLFAGLLVSLAWITTSFGINYLFTRTPFKLFLIDTGYYVTFFAIMGAIMGAW